MNQKIKLINKKGLRLDGRKPDELRPTTIQVGILSRADGSAYIQQGKNKISGFTLSHVSIMTRPGCPGGTRYNYYKISGCGYRCFNRLDSNTG